MQNIKYLMENLKKNEAKSDELDELWAADPENAELERAWDEQYKVVGRLRDELIREIVKFSGGLIDKRTATAMLFKKRDQLQSLIERLA